MKPLRRQLKAPPTYWPGAREKYHWEAIRKAYTRRGFLQLLRPAFKDWGKPETHIWHGTPALDACGCLDARVPDVPPSKAWPEPKTGSRLRLMKERIREGSERYLWGGFPIEMDFSAVEQRIAAMGVGMQEAARSLRELGLSVDMGQARRLQDALHATPTLRVEMSDISRETMEALFAGLGESSRSQFIPVTVFDLPEPVESEATPRPKNQPRYRDLTHNNGIPRRRGR